MSDFNIVKRDYIHMLSPQVAEQLREYRWKRVFALNECLMSEDDHGPKGVSPRIIKHLDGQRSVVYYGNMTNGSYNHHNQIIKFRGKFYYAWSCGQRDEEAAGQCIRMACSEDGKHWSEAWTVIEPEKGTGIAHNCVAIYSQNDELFIVVMTEDTIHDETAVGMRRVRPESHEVYIIKTSDLNSWTKCFSFGERMKWIFEAPRMTREGRLMCVCCTVNEGPGVLLWPGSDITDQPEIIFVPEPEGASFPYGEATWYQLETGRIVVFWRDESASCQLYVNWSDDGGKTFTAPALSDIPDSMSRVYAGRLDDGRYYLCNNALSVLLDRSALMLMLSDDGIVFNKVYMVNDGATSQRCKGMLKVNGYQYPCCCTDGDRLLIAYDANKEDPMVEIIDTKKL